MTGYEKDGRCFWGAARFLLGHERQLVSQPAISSGGRDAGEAGTEQSGPVSLLGFCQGLRNRTRRA